jgi:glycosyltransferase involved in cell wall biosynthesis
MAQAGSVAAILPLFNERHAVADLVRRMPDGIDQTIVVDDGSDDGGPELASGRARG